MTNPNHDYFRHVYAKHWLHGNRESRNATHYQYQEITLDALDCTPGCTLLECGCGSGDLLARLHERYPAIRLAGTDLATANLEHIARRPFREKIVQLFQSDVTSLPLVSDHFDRVLSSSVLWYVPDACSAIREMIRVLRPGGRFVFDVRNPYHITNLWATVSLCARRAAGGNAPLYSFFSPRKLTNCLETLPVEFDIVGYFVLIPTRLPLVRARWGDWSKLAPGLSFRGGRGKSRWLAQKLLVSGTKLA